MSRSGRGFPLLYFCIPLGCPEYGCLTDILEGQASSIAENSDHWLRRLENLWDWDHTRPPRLASSFPQGLSQIGRPRCPQTASVLTSKSQTALARYAGSFCFSLCNFTMEP